MNELLERRVVPRATGSMDRLSARDLAVLGWLCEQYGARVDHVAKLSGFSERSAQRLAVRLREAGFVSARRILVGEPAWVVPTGAGVRACGRGFAVWHPRVGQLAHVAAVNEVRLHVEARSPDAEWVCERELARERGQRREHLPDAVVCVGGQRVAVEVELTVKSKRRSRAILDDLSRRFDAVLYFCARSPRRSLEEFEASGRWPKLGVRSLPPSA